MRNKLLFILILLIVFSFVIRIYKLDTNPAGFFCDEASRGVDALSILKTGRDSHGEFLPIFFRGLNNAAAGPFYAYLNIPFIFIFGLTEKAIRLPATIIGTFEIIIFFLLLKEFVPESFALLGTLLLSISPWHLHTTRNNIGDIYLWTFLTLIAYLFLTRAFKENKIRFYIFSAFFFALTTYGYYPSRLITPILFAFALILLFFKRFFKRAIIISLVYLTILIPFIHLHLTNPDSLQRLKDTVNIDHNLQSNNFFKKYILHYSYTFLFQKGDADFPGQSIRRHSISGLGLFYPYQLPLIILGLFWIAREIIKKKKFELFFVIFLLLLFPLPDSLTSDATPFATRSYLGVLPFHILIAFGIYALFQLLQLLPEKIKTIGEIPTALTLFIVIVFSVFKLLQAFVNNPMTTSDFWGWQYGPRDIMKYFLTVKDQYDDLYMSGEYNGAEIFPKFYDPENTCQGKCKIEPVIYSPSRRQLFALSPDYLDKSTFKDNFSTKKILYYPNGKAAFLIGEVAL